MTNEILTQDEFDQAFNGMGYDRLGTCEMQIKGSHAAALARIAELERIIANADARLSFLDTPDSLAARIAELESEVTGLVTRILEKDRRIEKMELSQPVQLIDAHITPNRLDGSWAVDPEVAKAFVMDMAALFAETGADNYLEYTLRSRSCSDQFQVLIQKKAGQTPAEQNTELRAKIAELEAAQRWIPVSDFLANEDLSSKTNYHSRRVLVRAFDKRDSVGRDILELRSYDSHGTGNMWGLGMYEVTHVHILPPFPERLLKEAKNG